MNPTTDIKVLECLLAINLDVRIWSARKKLYPEDFGTTELPPEQLASLGSKRVCNPEELRIFSTLKSRATTLLNKTGIRFLGGWAIPEDKATEILKELEQIQDEFLLSRETFLGRYDETVHDWINQNPGWESLIAGSIVSVDHVRHKLDFRWQMFKVVNPATTPELQDVGSGLQDEVLNLGNTLFGEIAKTAADTWTKCYEGKTEITHRALSPLKSILHKLSGLSFVEPRVAPIADLIQAAFERLPAKGNITGPDLLMLQGLVCMLKDSRTLIEHGQRMIEGSTPDTILKDLLSQPSTLDDSHEDQREFSNPTDEGDIWPIPDKNEWVPTSEVPDISAPTAPEPQPEQHIDSLGLW